MRDTLSLCSCLAFVVTRTVPSLYKPSRASHSLPPYLYLFSPSLLSHLYEHRWEARDQSRYTDSGAIVDVEAIKQLVVDAIAALPP